MGRYDSHKNPFSYRMNQWARKRVNERFEREPKSMPCHVVKVEKDFVHVAFENQNGIFTLPVVKMTQAFHQYGRPPTQKGDKGVANPGNYYIGGSTGYAGGKTDFYPRGNLSSLAFHPASHAQSAKRDYDQHVETGGPSGWMVKVMDKQQGQQQQQGGLGGLGGLGGGLGGLGGGLGGILGGIGGGGGILPTAVNLEDLKIQGRRTPRHPPIIVRPGQQAIRLRGTTPPPTPSRQDAPITGEGSDTSGQSQDGQDEQDKDKTLFSFDKDGKALMQSKDTDHVITVDSQSKVISVKVPLDHTVYLGGDGKEGQYGFVGTDKGISKNTKARVS